MGDVTWQVLVDWDNDGNFTGPYDDISADVLGIELKGGRNGATDSFAAAQARVTLDNASLRYTRYNATSAIYGKMLPGRPVLIQAVHNAVTYPRFRGELIETGEGYSVNGIPQVQISFLDGWETLRRKKIRLGTLQENQRVDQVIGAILDAAGWPAGRRNLDVAKETLSYYWAFDAAAADELRTVGDNELGGQTYFDRNGDLRFENREYRGGSAVYATVSDADSVQLGMRHTDLVEKVQGTRSGLIADAAASNLFSLSPGGYRLKPGTGDPANTMVIKFDGGKSVVAPVVGVDVNANSAQDGTGTNKNAQLAVASFTAYAAGAIVTFNNLDSSDVFLFGSPALQIQGIAIRQSNDSRLLEATASAPIITGQVLSKAFDWNDNASGVAGWASYTASVLSLDQPRPVVKLLARTDAEIAVVLGIDISKRLTLALTSGLYPPGLSGDYFVEGFQLRAAPDQDIECSVTLWGKAQGFGGGFRISGALGGGQDYSQISTATPASSDDRIWF